MSEKVKLTREQAEAIENTEIKYGKDLTVIRHAERYFHDEEESRLTELTTAEVARALYIGYEVEKSFEVGDWVKDTSTNAVIKINDRQHRNNLIDPRHTTIRHATPKEIAEEKQRRWWAKHDRNAWELKQGDILKDKRNGFLYEYQRIGDAFLGKTIRLARFNEGRYDFWKNDVTEHFKVVCFAEDRKDIDGGDSE